MKTIDEIELRKYYYNDRLTLVEIAEKFDVCKHTIQRRLKSLKMPKRENLSLVEDLKDVKINNLTFLEYLKNDKFGKAVWLCRCDCGKEKPLNASAIKAGLTTSCGCNRRKSLSKGYELISGAFWHKLKKNALSRNLDFIITIEEAWEIYEQQEMKCALSGVDLVMFPNHDKSRKQTASPDRIDSTIGYTKNNFQWVHKRINRMKNVLTNEELLFWVRKIYENNKELKQEEYNVNELTWD
jgi:hypothetical protein